ncbi:DeoR/GlpR family DNA-binding transcription regulator [Bacillus sp. 03113]|uniref:DeoR/GlpR family DNA-binding transcription regulator n=1 Tax=Bacillus sp. 03113 TaxID=2578211 RepID=UPI001143C02C|nr:DeoR/GlpR family DNA-binding transcription regulator [Bacillus sp. 03113]
MFQEERLWSILEYLKQNNRISVDEICSFYDVSRDTARRDLVKLEEQHQIIRTRGGAILSTTHHEIKDYKNRLETVSKEKKRIGKRAAALIKQEDSVLLDASTTVQACAEFIEQFPCTIITNSINLADILSNKSAVQIHLLGGKFHKDHRYLYGPSIIERLNDFFVDKVFIGVVGISEHGLTNAYEEDGAVKRKMMKQAKQVIILADHSKIGVTGLYRFADLSEVDLFITDKTPPEPFINLLEKNHVELLICDED